MSIKKIVLLCGFFLFLATSVIAYQYWEELLQLMGVKEKSVAVIQPTVKSRHAPISYRQLQELIEGLQNQSLDESFAQLLDDKQYPLYMHPSNNRSGDIVRITESPCFLKVFQQFGELPKEQAIEKLHVFCEQAIKEFGDSLERSLIRNAAQAENVQKGNPLLSPTELFEITGTYGPSIVAAKYMVCVTLFLAARLGENDLLLSLINAMQPLVDAYIEGGGYSRRVALLEDDCIFTVLMYAIERKEGKLDIAVPNTKIKTTKSLYRWNTNPDQDGARNDEDVVDQITVYISDDTETSPIGLADQQLRHLIETLKERLAK